MKILYHVLYPYGLGDDRFTYEGYKDAFEDFGHETLPLTEKDDFRTVLREYQPDIFIAEANLMDLIAERETLQNFRSRGGRVVLHGAMTSVLAHEIAEREIVNLYFSEIDPRGEFPEFPSERFVKMHWLAASKKYHFPTSPSLKYTCDILYIGANLPKKRNAFERLLLPLRKKYHVRIFGFDWDFLDRYVLHPLSKLERRFLQTGTVSSLRLRRQVPLHEENVAYASAKICLNFHEMHPDTSLKTINARTFKIPASGGFEICDYVPQVREFFNEDEVVISKEDHWFEVIEHYVKNDKERKAIQERGTKRALKDHTFHSRVHTVLETLS